MLLNRQHSYSSIVNYVEEAIVGYSQDNLQMQTQLLFQRGFKLVDPLYIKWRENLGREVLHKFLLAEEKQVEHRNSKGCNYGPPYEHARSKSVGRLEFFKFRGTSFFP